MWHNTHLRCTKKEMYRVQIPIAQFYRLCLQAAAEGGFDVVLCLVGRKADSPRIYEEIVRNWSSLHDLTGEQILFVFAGDPPEEHNHGVRHCHEEILLYSPGIAVRGANRLSFSLPITPDQV